MTMDGADRRMSLMKRVAPSQVRWPYSAKVDAGKNGHRRRHGQVASDHDDDTAGDGVLEAAAAARGGVISVEQAQRQGADAEIDDHPENPDQPEESEGHGPRESERGDEILLRRARRFMGDPRACDESVASGPEARRTERATRHIP